MQAQLEQIFSELKILLRNENFLLDSQNKATLSCDGLLLHIAISDEERMCLSSWVGSVPSGEDRGIVLTALLSANHFFGLTNGATLALDPATNHIWLHQTLSLAGANAQKIFTSMDTFVESAATWFDRLNPKETTNTALADSEEAAQTATTPKIFA